MTPQEAVSRLRTYLDEAQTGFYEDAEIYYLLSDGIKELVTILYNVYKTRKTRNASEPLPEILKFYEKTVYNNFLYSPQDNLPTDFLFPVSVLYSVNGSANQKPCLQRETSDAYSFLRDNIYLQSTASQPYYIIKGGVIYFESPVTGTGAATLSYIRKPLSVNQYSGTLDVMDTGANAALQYAYSLILRKDLRSQESLAEYQVFLKQLQQLYI